MYSSKLLYKGWFAFTCSLFLWTSVAFSSPEEFHVKTPVNRLPVPIDFNEMVYAETTTTAQVTFNSTFDKQSPDYQAYSLVVDVNPRRDKVSWKIKCDWLHRTAKITASCTVENQPQEDVEDYAVISHDPKNVCLLYTSNNTVHVITMNSDIGSYVMSINRAAGISLVNGTLIWYGFCRN